MTTRSLDIPWGAIVRRVDPDRDREIHNEVEYEFQRRTFRADRARRGAYAPLTYDFGDDFSRDYLTLTEALEHANGF